MPQASATPAAPHAEQAAPPLSDPPTEIKAVNSGIPMPVSGNSDSSLAVFEKRILPIFQSNKPSSCAECHLSGVDLKDYIHPTPQKTFAALVSAQMINLEKPDESKILQFIGREPEKPSLITKAVRAEELDAFRTWIRASVNDPTINAKGEADLPIGPQLPLEVIRHARKDRVLASFITSIWTEVGRCAACHSPDRNQEQVKKHGEQVSWIKLKDPQGTLNYMVDAGLIDAEVPENSLLLQKPTLQVKHGGGQKMVVGDRSYKQFRRFLDDYSAITKGKYKQEAELPKVDSEASVVSDVWLKLTDVPAKFDKMLLQVDLYRFNEGEWTPYRVATSDRAVFGAQNLWQHSLSLTAPTDSPWAQQIRQERLPQGKYRVKIYVDQAGKLQRDFTATLGEEDFVGEIEAESSWEPGYGKMTVLKFPAPK